MIAKLSVIAVFASVLNAGSGSPAYTSNVKVQRTNVLPYVEYGIPAVPGAGAAPLLAQLSTAPASAYGKVAACVSPCVIDPASGDYVRYGPPARIITGYQAPVQNVPVVYPKADGSNYEYSYLVIDDSTGDQKAQHELSEDGVVRGQYSLVQPDGYVREVQYTADDITGFNAIVKNFLPKTSNIEAGGPAGDKKDKIIVRVPTDQPTTVKVAEDVPPTNPPTVPVDIITITAETIKDTQPTPASTPTTTATEISTEVKPDVPPLVIEPKKIILTYEDLVRCATGLNSIGGVNQPSALTYILLPSLGLNRPC